MTDCTFADSEPSTSLPRPNGPHQNWEACRVNGGFESSTAGSQKALNIRNCPAIVAIPARNEAGRIRRCLAALAVQRDCFGAPIESGSFGILLLVNNSA